MEVAERHLYDNSMRAVSVVNASAHGEERCVMDSSAWLVSLPIGSGEIESGYDYCQSYL